MNLSFSDPKGRKKIAGGKRSAAPGSQRFKVEPLQGRKTGYSFAPGIRVKLREKASALKARSSKAQGEGCEAAETLGWSYENKSPARAMQQRQRERR
jgi:hypothetical protein